MSTPALIKFETDGAVYLHYDGYPEDIYSMWDNFVREMSDNTGDTRLDDAPYLAARFVAWYTGGNFTTLGIGICHPDVDYGQCYTYKIDRGRISRV